MDSTSYTPSANQVLLLAQEQANYFKHQAIGTEHLLLALVMEENGVAGQVLRQALVSSVDVKEEIERLAGYGTLRRQAPDNYLPYSPKAKAILNDALSQAMMMGSSKIGTEHLLLALLNDDNILSSRILYSLQIDTRRLRQLLLRQLGMTDRQRQRLAKRANEESKRSKTETLDGLASDMTAIARNEDTDPVIGRTSVFKIFIDVLSVV